MKNILTISLLLYGLVCPAQNLVPDSGFENAFRLPNSKNNPLTCTKDWMSPTGSASDYYHKKGGSHAGVPQNIFGHQKPHAGIAYAGICVRTNLIEYVQTKLIRKLEKDRDYLVEFYISRAEISVGSAKEFGILFTPKMTYGLSNKGIQQNPDIEFLNPAGYKSQTKWMKFSVVYHAQGNEAVFILGPFKNNHTKPFKGFAHYYIDDVSITPIEKKPDALVSNEAADSISEIFSPKMGETITLQNIFFGTNKSELLPQSFVELNKLVEYLNHAPNTSIKISEHTDNTGNEDQNNMLSESRAKAVADYLTLKEIDQARIMYAGYGSSKPIAANNTDEEKQQNRRVDFIINKR